MVTPPASLLVRALDRLRQDGLSGLWWRSLRWLGVYRSFVFAGGANVPPVEPPPEMPVECARLGSEEIEEYLTFRPDQARDAIRRRFEDGDRCFVGRTKGRIVAATWIAYGSAWLDFVPCRIGLSERTFYTYDAHVARELRGQRVANAILDFRAAQMRKAGYDRKVSLIEPENRPAFQRNARRGIPAVARLSCVRLGPWRRLRIHAIDGEADPLVTLV